MLRWKQWWQLARRLRPACTRLRTFVWLAVVLAGITVRHDLWGITSIVRALGLKEMQYDRRLDLFHSPALKLSPLTTIWKDLIFKHFSTLSTLQGRYLILGDGLKVPKAGKKMPAVKKLYQESASNPKPQYIFGHYCQAVAILAGGLKSSFAVPLTSRIHDGLVFSNRDKKTSLAKMIDLLISLQLEVPYSFSADAYYASKKIVRQLLELGQHLITRVRSNATAYLPCTVPATGKKGRPKQYGKKIKLKTLFQDTTGLQTAPSPIYGEKKVLIRYIENSILTRKGRYLPITTIRTDHGALGNAVEKAGIKNFRFHDFRHTAASNLRRKGVRIELIMAIGGWKTIPTFFRYSNYSDEELVAVYR